MRFFSLLACAVVCAPVLFAQENGDHEGADATGAPEQREITLQCSFETECFEAESCADTTFSGQLIGRAQGLNAVDMVVQAELITEIGDTLLLGARSGKAFSLVGGDFEARHLLTIAAGGAARYTLHYADGPMAISYLGDCK